VILNERWRENKRAEIEFDVLGSAKDAMSIVVMV
jgi:hypothetical protein